MKRIYSGNLNRRITVLRQIESKNAAAEVVTTSEEIESIKAMRRDVSGGENLQGKLVNNNTVEFVVRRQDYLLQSGEVLLIQDVDGVFSVTSVSLTGQQNRFLKLACYKQDFETPNA